MTKDSSAKYYHKRKIATKKGTRKISKPVQRRKRKKKRQYGRKRYKNLPKDETQRLAEYRKINILKSIKVLILKILVRAHIRMRYTKRECL